MKLCDRLALILAVAAFFLAAYFSINVYESTPHIEDEITYVWQARLAAAGNLVTSSPVCTNCFLEPFVIDQNGIRFGKYSPGWPAALSLGIRLGIRDYVNPFLSALYVWLAYLLVKKLLDPVTALISTGLTVISPFFLMNSGTLLAHPWSLLLTITFSHGWIDSLDDTKKIPRWMTISTAGLSMGLQILTRPLTAIGICLPFFIHGIYLLIKGTSKQKQTILTIGLISSVFVGLYLLWQYRVTGDPFTNPYVLYWPYDKVGFGADVGLNIGGHQLIYAWDNTHFSLHVGYSDLFGWPYLSWIFLPFGFVAIRKNRKTWPIAGIFFSLVFAYAFYWIGAWVFGPRYYYEGLISLTMLTAAGMRWLAGNAWKGNTVNAFTRVRFILTWVIVLIFVIGDVMFYLPIRTETMRGLYGVTGSQLSPFKTQTAQNLSPALVIVTPQKYWLEYGVLLDLSSPLLDTPLIFVYDRGEEINNSVINAFPERTVIYYNTGNPYQFMIKE